MKQTISTTIDSKVLEKFDKLCGLVPRSTYINQMMVREIRNDEMKKETELDYHQLKEDAKEKAIEEHFQREEDKIEKAIEVAQRRRNKL